MSTGCHLDINPFLILVASMLDEHCFTLPHEIKFAQSFVSVGISNCSQVGHDLNR